MIWPCLMKRKETHTLRLLGSEGYRRRSRRHREDTTRDTPPLLLVSHVFKICFQKKKKNFIFASSGAKLCSDSQVWPGFAKFRHIGNIWLYFWRYIEYLAKFWTDFGRFFAVEYIFKFVNGQKPTGHTVCYTVTPIYFRLLSYDGIK